MTITASCQNNRQPIESDATGRRYREERIRGIGRERGERERETETEVFQSISSLKHTVLSDPDSEGSLEKFVKKSQFLVTCLETRTVSTQE